MAVMMLDTQSVGESLDVGRLMLATEIKARRKHIREEQELDKKETARLYEMGERLEGVYHFTLAVRESVDYKAVLATLADKYGIPRAEVDAACKVHTTEKDYKTCTFD